MPAPTISALTPAPNRLDPNFATVADAFLNGFPALRAEINAFANYLNTTALVSYAFSDGTAAQPSLRFASDGDTGVFRPASNTLGFSAGGSERMRINANGNVAIGRTNPEVPLDVEGTIRMGQTGSGSRLQFRRPTDGAVGAHIGYPEDTNNDLQLRNFSGNGKLILTSGGSDTVIESGFENEVARITSLGRLGLMTNSPAARLDLGFASATNQHQAILARPSGGDNAFRLYAGTGGGYNPYEDYFKIGITHNSTQNASVNFHRGGSTTGGFLSFSTSDGSEKMRLDEFGRLAVGTTGNLNAAITARRDGTGVQEALNLANWKSTSGEVGVALRMGYGDVESGYGTRIVNYGNPAALRAGSLVFERGVAAGADYRETMRIHNNGHVGINQPNPSSLLDIAANLGPEISLTRTGSADGNGIIRSVGNTGVVNASIVLGGGSSNTMVFSVAGSERMRLGVNGDLTVGKSSPSNSAVGAELRNNGEIAAVRNGANALYLNRLGASDGTIAIFAKENATVGSVSVTATGTAFNTSSDYRLKEDLKDILTPADRLMQLNPVNVSWKADGTRSDTFIAHELAEVLPYAVTGEKDAADPDGNPEYQSVDYSKVVPLLTAALQEALTKIENLETRINVMESQE
tara:strand:- start:3593 stop:5497 length:1905 start_codon:yes stop_codon:yes gene_type:complete